HLRRRVPPAPQRPARARRRHRCGPGRPRPRPGGDRRTHPRPGSPGRRGHARARQPPGGDAMTDQHVVYQVEDRTAWIRIDRPERRNAMAVQTTEELIAAFVRAGEDPDVWAIVLTGTGDRAFCAGGDLKEMDETARAGRDIAVPMTGLYRNVFEVILETPKPTVAAVNGAALAG